MGRKISLLLITFFVFCFYIFYPEIYPVYHLSRINSYKNAAEKNNRIYWFLRERLSKSGWILQSSENSPTYANAKNVPISIDNVDFPLVSYRFSIPREFHLSEFTSYPSASSWSPDGRSLLLVKSAAKTCTDQNFAIFHYSNGFWEGPYYSKITSKEYGNCYGMVWSEDSTKLAVYSFPGGNVDSSLINIKIFSTKAELLQDFSIRITATEDCAIKLYWEMSNFYLTQWDPFNEMLTGNIYKFSSIHPNEVMELLTLPVNSRVINKDSNSNRVLLATKGGSEGCELLVFNLDNNQIDKSIYFPSSCGGFDKSPDNKLHLFFVNENSKLMVKNWDWKKVGLTDIEEVEDWLGWDQNLKSFILIKKDSNQNLYLDLLAP
jgi:hypothetical protein